MLIALANFAMAVVEAVALTVCCLAGVAAVCGGLFATALWFVGLL
ncbi:hypothetical protein [Bradyrhizobium pachyrhizi]|nr:hypothetical protein [Bradyrhizobium pachyrhizi]